ncbi:MAG TPA: hypothetical protein VK175_04685 [Leadbetterella sp.]|nr:hypothetical protein [Leadbetterella sp.]
MKNKLLIILVALVALSCSKMEEVGSLRILGSNTEKNFFNETTDNQNVFLKKKEFHVLNSNFVSNLNLTKFNPDSLDIERIAGRSDSLLLLSKTGLKLFLKETNKTIQLKNFGFSTCDQMALVDSFVVVSQGKTACQPDIATKFSLFKINKFTELVYLNQYLSASIIDLKVMKRKIFMLDSEGFLSAFEVKNGNEISKITEVNVPGAEFIRIIPNLSKVLVKTDKKVIQFGFKANKFEKVNEI